MSDVVQVPTRSLDYLERAIANVNNKVDYVNSHLSQVDTQLNELKKNFLIMIIEQRQQAALQRALTEIIRVRQELEQRFGNQKQVRDTILGILQATDSALVSGETISRCSEELMLSTPKYWLAPCVVAVAAWIGKNKALALRAAEEAVKRDVEKTCLLFALICRRNGRSEACFAWLSKYLQRQNPHNMKKSVVAFIDAYTNGVFGVDKDKTCDGFIKHWIKELAQDANFDNNQKSYWKDYFNIAGASVSYKSQGYEDLKELSIDFPKIDGFVSRITAVCNEGGARDKIARMYAAKVDMDKLVKDVDDQLIKLVRDYEEGDEAKLRDEEIKLQKIKDYKGDEKRAEIYMEKLIKGRKDHPVDFASRLCSAFADPYAPLSSKKTALFLLKEYIIEAYQEYIHENKDAYPENISLKIEDNVSSGHGVKWVGSTALGENLTQMKKDIKEKYDTARDQAIEAARTPKGKYIALCIFTLGIYVIIDKKKFAQKKEHLTNLYNDKANKACQKLESAMGARVETNQIVSDFLAQPDWDTINFEAKEEA